MLLKLNMKGGGGGGGMVLKDNFSIFSRKLKIKIMIEYKTYLPYFELLVYHLIKCL